MNIITWQSLPLWIVCSLTSLLAGSAFSQQTIVLEARSALRTFEGIGAVSGGGGTSVLLKDYPEPQRSEILDLLFKPNVGASMQTLYVEVGSDGNATQGSEPTHMRTREDENYFRGYEWWLMSEAKKRNPSLTLDACAWGCPGWIGNGNFWSQDMCDYYVKWIKGLKAHHGLDLDAVGCRNERGSVIPWVTRFRKTLNESGLSGVRIHAFDNPGNQWMWDWIPELNKDDELAVSVDVIGNHCLTNLPMPADVRGTLEKLGKPLWNTEEHVYNEEARHFNDDFECALAAVNLFNRNYIDYGATKVVNWYLVGSTYPIEPYYNQPPAMFASSPWSGHYELKPILWSYAHYGQFTKVGWKYIASACRKLEGGGTVVALKSEDKDFSIILETAGAKGPQQVTFQVGEGLSVHSLCVWRTTKDARFEKQPAPRINDRTFTLTLLPDAIYSFSTTTGQNKGTSDSVPPTTPFPLPYFETFDQYGSAKSWGYLPHFTADICGVFELSERPDRQGQCLQQVVSQKVQSWAPEWKPYTIIGDEQWTDYEVSADVVLDGGGWAGLMGRVSNTGNGWEGNPTGYYCRLYPDGGCALYSAAPQYKGAREKQLALGSADHWKPGQWHHLMLRFEGKTISVLVDGACVFKVDDSEHQRGMAGLITAGDDDARHTGRFDNLLINNLNGAQVNATTSPELRTPLYRP